ncbi:XRE family transcriptional regulator, partial [Rhizobiaceae sp. 2RAB30]
MENIRPIKTEDDYNRAPAEITRYFENQPRVGTPDGDRFDVIAIWSKHTSDRCPHEARDPISAIKA